MTKLFMTSRKGQLHSEFKKRDKGSRFFRSSQESFVALEVWGFDLVLRKRRPLTGYKNVHSTTQPHPNHSFVSSEEENIRKVKGISCSANTDVKCGGVVGGQ